MRKVRVWAVVFLLFGGVCSLVGGQDKADRTRVALYALAGPKGDPALESVLLTVAGNVELSLDLLDRYDVRRLPAVDPAADLATVRSYCEANKIDQAILGSGVAQPRGGYDFRLVVYDRKTDAITVDKRGSSNGVLDMFDTTDALVASLLSGLSGTHLLFGSLTVETDPTGATVAINGRDVGQSPVSLRGVPVGTVTVTARGEGREDGQATVQIVDGQSSDQTLSLGRSAGTLFVQLPSDAQVVVSSPEIGQKQFTGPGSVDLPTGEYDVTATSPGLSPASGKITVTRKATESWMPWTKGYLVVQATPGGATVMVDGDVRGKAPVVVEVDAGRSHHVELSLEKYDSYAADVSVAAGSKTAVSAQLAALPGSISVVTSIAGVDVQLDGGARGRTPFVFTNVSAGSHALSIQSLRRGDQALSAGPTFQVVVSPGTQTDVVKEMVRGRAHLKIVDAPPGSAVQVDGSDVDAAQALGDGIEVPAGMVTVVVNGPETQKWDRTSWAAPDALTRWSLYDMTWHVPRRTIPLDAGADQWSPLLPTWKGMERHVMPYNQPGISIADGYVSQDDKSVYVRFRFSDGAPSKEQPADHKLSYFAIIRTENKTSDEIWMVLDVSPNSINTRLRINHPLQKNYSEVPLAPGMYRVGSDSLQFQFPIDKLRPYIAAATSMYLGVSPAIGNAEGWVARTREAPVNFAP